MRTDLPPPAEVALGRIATGVADMLKREMDQVFEQLLEVAGQDWGTPRYHAAQQAYRIILLCRSLIEEIHDYEATGWRDEDADQDVPF
jgi:hypothetical protein